ncbi:hypothetical protein, partial [Streptomyces ossamyceticus]|uniref:hypothetical protein n=1 Tax=Streptomyces ossamyceticus TaxID=249581 RepID=UPI001969F7ED
MLRGVKSCVTEGFPHHPLPMNTPAAWVRFPRTSHVFGEGAGGSKDFEVGPHARVHLFGRAQPVQAQQRG